MQGRNVTRTEGVVASNGLMAAWLASGGVLEALADVDASPIRSRQTDASEDDGLRAVMNTALASCGVPDDGRFAARASIHYACGDDGLQAFGLTTGRHAC